jgi:hypothetical protein
MSKKAKGINPVLERELDRLLKQVMTDPTSSLTDKCKIIDRVINVEKIKARMDDSSWGESLLGDDDESQDND